MCRTIAISDVSDKSARKARIERALVEDVLAHKNILSIMYACKHYKRNYYMGK